MKAILLDEAKKWLEENCESLYTKMAVFGLMQSMPTVDYQEEPNEPLTFAELREMEGEPVWVEHNNGGEWLVIHWDYVGRITTAHKACLLDYEYGRTWLAYRHPLEGEANG